MNKYYLSLAVSLVLLLVGCEDNETIGNENQELKSFSTFIASIGNMADTRASIQNASGKGAKSIVWNDNDVISVFSDTQRYMTSFTLINSNSGSGTFTGKEVIGRTFYALYSSSNSSLDEGEGNVILTNIGAGIATDERSYPFSGPMVAVSDGNTFIFKQTTGMIHISVGSVNKIHQIKLIGNNDEKLSGLCYVDLSESEPICKIKSGEVTQNYLLAEFTGQGSDAYFVIPPTIFTKGFTIEIQGENGEGSTQIIKKTFSSEIQVDRASVNHFTLIDFDAELEKMGTITYEHKEYLENVALEFMEMMPSSDFKEIAELGRYMYDTYGDAYDWDGVNSWAKNVYNASREALGNTWTETETYSWDGWDETYIYNDIYTDYKSLILASKYTGHFVAGNGGWIREDAENLQFIFTDKAGKQCILKLETSGTVKNVHITDVKDWTGSYVPTEAENNDYIATGTYIYTDYYDYTKQIIGVPEKIVVTLTQGDTQVIKTIVNFNLDEITNEEFDISKNNLSATMTTELSNGYKFVLSEAKYNANKNASASFSMSKNGISLISASVATDVNGLPSMNASALAVEDLEADDFANTTVKNGYVKLDILGKVQLFGQLSDVRKCSDYIHDANDNDENEALFKSYINQANTLTDIGLYYNGNNEKQADVKLEPFTKEKWDGRLYWYAEPVIIFSDDTSYSTFTSYFNEVDFKKVIDTFKALVNKYADLIGEKVDW